MQSLLEFLPLVAFLIAYYLGGLYTATAVLMVAMALLLVVDFLRMRRIPPMHGLSAGLVFIFGAATLLLQDQRFIQWKPTVFFWLVSAVFLGNFWIGKRLLIERLLGAVLNPDTRLPDSVWRMLNALWVAFYAALGAANLLVAFNASESTWVKFKVFGLTLITLVFVAFQVIWLTRRAAATTPSS